MATNALEITSGEELLRFDLGDIVEKKTRYTVLTGYEGTGKCWWCGGEIQGKRSRHYCPGHGELYRNHFQWQYAAAWCQRRANYHCQLCGISRNKIPSMSYFAISGYRVHHIVPINGGDRFFSAYNLPWNLVALCHTCHMAIHKIMSDDKKAKKPIPVTKFDEAVKKGQLVLI